MRLMGKRQIGEMQPFEFIITLLIAELACIPMTDISIPLSYGIVSLLAVFILHQAMSLLERLGNKVKFLISGKPSIVITPNGIDIKELKKNNLDIADLAEALRESGYFCFDDVDYAIFESNGKLSALKSNKESSCALPYILINDGKVQKDNLKAKNLTVEDIKKQLNLTDGDLKKIVILTVDENGRAYLQKQNEKFNIVYFKGEKTND